MTLIKQTVDEWLDQVDYGYLNSGSYNPTNFALKFMNFIKMVNGSMGESHQTPVVHLKMLDKIASDHDRVANLCARGLAKTTLMFEYLVLYIAVFGEIDNFGTVDGMIYVSDSMENGVKNARKNIEFRYHSSEWLQQWIHPKQAKFTDNYLEFTNVAGKKLGVKMFGAKALSLDSKIFLAKGGTTTIGECSVGDIIMGADGKPTCITKKSEIFHKPMYEIKLQDGRTLKVSEDHLNQVHIKKFQSEKTFSKYILTEKTLTTLELLEEPLFAKDPNGSQRPLVWVENCKPMEWPHNEDILLDPYTVGVLIGDGSMNGKADGSVPVVLTSHEDDWPTYEKNIPYSFGKIYKSKKNPTTISRTIQKINHLVEAHNLDTHGDFKRIPEEFLYGSVEQRLALLQGLMDTDGTCTKDGKSSFCSNSKELVSQVMWLTRSLGGESRWVDKGNIRAYQCTVRLNMPLFKLERKLIRQRKLRNDKIAIVSIKRIADEPSQCIAVDNEERQFVAEDFFRTHNTGLRGTKIFGKRPVLAVLDDLVSDEDSKSKVAMEAIKDTVYKGVNFALDPTRKKIIFNGTPFNKDDILYEAVESGTWDVNVWPVCDKFPCSKEEFRGAWEDRFTYEYVKKEYQMALDSGRLAAFQQELMLRISSSEERLVQDSEIRWYDRKTLLSNKERFNFYITTDFAISAKQLADLTVISVWAYNHNGDWFLVDGIAKRQLMDQTFNDLFRLAQEYEPLSVGIERAGQQGGFIPLIEREMLQRNIWFNLARDKNQAGLTTGGMDKLARFQLVVPWFKAGKMFFPSEIRDTEFMGHFISQISLATINGLKGKDDCIDTISMLNKMNPWKPSNTGIVMNKSNGVWDMDDIIENSNNLSSYIV